jgi:dienelactone hydrolase
MKKSAFVILGLLLLAGCGHNGASVNGEHGKAMSLTEARKGFTTRLVPSRSAKDPVPEPPPEIFRAIRYESPAGKLAAYVTPDPNDGKQHPAIIWITGGDCNSIGEVWEDAPASNDQTASAFRKSGIVMMFPSLRGGNENPGAKEGFFGEVDDVLAAADYLGRQKYVNPKRIYLGGHSTGGTLVFLVAESSDRFRAVFSFGPVADVRPYPSEFLPFDTSSSREIELRSPIHWLESVSKPLFVFEGADQGNVSDLQALRQASTNPLIHFLLVRGANHFSTLATTTRLIAGKVLRDDGPACNLTFTEEELSRRGSF